jgi:hypothetical protein
MEGIWRVQSHEEETSYLAAADGSSAWVDG